VVFLEQKAFNWGRAKKGLKRVFFDDFGEKVQKRRKMSNFGQKWRFFDVF